MFFDYLCVCCFIASVIISFVMFGPISMCLLYVLFRKSVSFCLRGGMGWFRRV